MSSPEREAVPLRRGGIRPRHLFFAAALLAFAGGFVLAPSTHTLTLSHPTYTDPGVAPVTQCSPGTFKISCVGLPPTVHPGYTEIQHEHQYRVGIVFGGAVVALLLAGIGLAVDRR